MRTLQRPRSDHRAVLGLPGRAVRVLSRHRIGQHDLPAVRRIGENMIVNNWEWPLAVLVGLLYVVVAGLATVTS